MFSIEEMIKRAEPAIKALTDQCGIGIERIDYVSGGKTNESYLVVGTDGTKYLARIAGPGTDAYIDRDKELNNLMAAEKIGVAPKLYGVNGGDLLMAFIDGVSSRDQSYMFRDNNTEKLTKQIRKLHDSGVKFKGEFSFIADHELYKKDFLTTNYPIPEELKAHEEELYEITKWVDEKYTGDLCPIHTDVVLQNFILTDERAYLVDWEYSTVADRYLDLASFCTQNVLAPGGEEMFLASYFKDSGRELDPEKFLLYKLSISFMWIYWHLNSVAHDRDIFYNDYRWRMHLNNALVCKAKWEAGRW